MMLSDQPTPADARDDDAEEPVLRDQRRRLDERDETIRLLNEALTAALDELEREGDLAA